MLSAASFPLLSFLLIALLCLGFALRLRPLIFLAARQITLTSLLAPLFQLAYGLADLLSHQFRCREDQLQPTDATSSSCAFAAACVSSLLLAAAVALIFSGSLVVSAAAGLGRAAVAAVASAGGCGFVRMALGLMASVILYLCQPNRGSSSAAMRVAHVLLHCVHRLLTRDHGTPVRLPPTVTPTRLHVHQVIVLAAVTKLATFAIAVATAACDAARSLACFAIDFGLLLQLRSPIANAFAAASAGMVLTW